MFKGPVLGPTKDWDWTKTGPKLGLFQSWSQSQYLGDVVRTDQRPVATSLF